MVCRKHYFKQVLDNLFAHCKIISSIRNIDSFIIRQLDIFNYCIRHFIYQAALSNLILVIHLHTKGFRYCFLTRIIIFNIRNLFVHR